MKKLPVAMVAMLGFAAFAETDVGEALNTEYMYFSTSEADGEGSERPWELVEGAGASGGWAVRGPIGKGVDGDSGGNCEPWEPDLHGFLLADIDGACGTLSFSWKRSGGANCNYYMYVDGDYRPIPMYGPKATSGEWNRMEIPLYTDGSHSIEWYSSGADGALMLSDFLWTPAPETTTVAFNANGGTATAATAREYAPGDCYGALPSATRKNYTFLGWHRDGIDGQKENAAFRVPLKESTTLVAKWGSAVTAFNTKQLTAFKSTGTDKWYAVDTGSGKVAEVEPKGTMKKMAGFYGGQEYRLVDTSSALQTTTTAAGYLKFEYSLATFANPEQGATTSPWISLDILLDGQKIESDEALGENCDSGEKTVYVYIPSGKHVLKFSVKGNPGYFRQEDEDGDVDGTGPLPRARIWGFEFEPAGPQPDLKSWMGKVRSYKSWRTGDLAKFASAYKTRMIADSEDYEARILYAATRLGSLAENKLFTDTAKTFGMTIDWARLAVKPPKPKFDKKSTAVNTLADKTIALAEPVIKDVQKALAGIPDDWSGSVSFDPAEWPVDEAVAFDIADVKFARAGLDAALAGLYFLGGYDMTLNWPKVQAAIDLETKIPAIKSIPAVGDTAAWEKSARCFRTSVETDGGDGDSSGTGALAVKGDNLLLRLGYGFADGFLDETNQIQNFDFYIKSGDRKLNIYGEIYGENGRQDKPAYCWFDEEWGGYVCEAPESNRAPRNYISQTNVYCTVWDMKTDADLTVPAKIQLVDGALLLNVDLSKLNLGTKKKPVKFSAKTWSIVQGYVGVCDWNKSEWAEFDEYPDSYYGWWDEETGWYKSSWWDDETQSWQNLSPDEDPDDYRPYYEYYKNRTGSVEWKHPSDAERRTLKFLNDQTSLFSKVRDAARLGAAKRHFESALSIALAADEKALERPEEGPMHFFEYDPADEAKIAFARSNTQRALSSLANAVEIDWAKVAEDFDAAEFKTNGVKLADYDYSLLPDDGMARVFLGALFEGKINRSMLPPMRANAYGEIVPDFEGMKDPTIGGLFPDMTADAIAKLSGRYEADRELDHGGHVDLEALEALPKPGEKITLSFEQYKGWTASDLPKGWKWDKKTGVLTGTVSATTSVKFTKGKSTATETIQAGEKPSALIFSDNEEAVAVTGTGLYNVGATVKAVAAVKAGYAFGGWYAQDGSLAFAGASYSFKMPREGVVLTARTVPLSGEYGDRLFADGNSGEEALALGEEVDLSVFNNIESGTPFTVAAAGLPPGLSLVSAMKQDAESGFCYGTAGVGGTPSKAGVYYATFVVKNNGGFKWTHVVRFAVGDAAENVQNAAKIDFAALDGMRPVAGLPFYAELPFEPKTVKNGVVAAKKITVSGLPSGLKMRYSSSAIEIAGIPAAAGKYSATFTIAYADKKSAKSVKTLVVDEYGGIYVPAGVVDNDPSGTVRGTATATGVRQYGQSVKFTAKSNDAKKWFFAGWYLDPAATIRADEAFFALGDGWSDYEYNPVDYRAATLTAQICDFLSPGDGMYAKFVTKSEDYATIQFPDPDDPDGPVWRVAYDAEEGAWSNFQVEIASETKATLSATGLPAGTKVSGTRLVVSKAASLVPGWYTATLAAKTASGATTKEKVRVHVANLTAAVDNGIVAGLDTSDEGYGSDPVNEYPFTAGVKTSFKLSDLGVSVAKGWTLSVSNLPKGWSYNAKTGVISGTATKAGSYAIVFTVSKKSGKKTVSHKASATFNVEGLSGEYIGEFRGCSSNVTVDGDGYEWVVAGEDGIAVVNVAASGAITASCTVNGTKYSFTGKGYEVQEGSLVARLSGKYGKSAVTLLFEPVGLVDYLAKKPVDAETLAPVDGCEYSLARISGAIPGGKKLTANLEQNVWKVEGLAEYLPSIAAGTMAAFAADAGEMSLKFSANGTVACAYATANGANTASSVVSGILHVEGEDFWTARVGIVMPAKTVTVKSGKKTVKKTVPGYSDTVEVRFSSSGAAPGVLDTAEAIDTDGMEDD